MDKKVQGGESHGGVGMLIARYSTAEYLARTVTRYVLSQLPIFLSISFVVSSVSFCLCLSYFIKKMKCQEWPVSCKSLKRWGTTSLLKTSDVPSTNYS